MKDRDRQGEQMRQSVRQVIKVRGREKQMEKNKISRRDG